LEVEFSSTWNHCQCHLHCFHGFLFKEPVCRFVPFQEQRYFRVLNAAKRSCKFGKKSPPFG